MLGAKLDLRDSGTRTSCTCAKATMELSALWTRETRGSDGDDNSNSLSELPPREPGDVLSIYRGDEL